MLGEARESKKEDSVAERLCETLRGPGDSCSITGCEPSPSGATMDDSLGVVLPESSMGDEGSRLISIVLRISCSSSSKFSTRRVVRGEISSSSLELWVESGGEMMAPAGIDESVTGGGDWRRLGFMVRLVRSDVL